MAKSRRGRNSTRVFVAAVVLGLSLTVSAVASAQTGEVTVHDGEARVAVVYAPGGITPGASGQPAPVDWPYICYWFIGAFPEEVTLISNPIPGRWYSLTCNPRPGSDRPFIFVITPYTPGVPIPGEPGFVDTHAVRNVAQAAPPPLPVGISPEDTQITGVETWLWPDGPTDTIQTAASAGGLTVWVEARYVETVFDLGDGNTVTCRDAVAWTEGATSSSCAHTYLTENAGRRITATSQWDYYWWDNAANPADPDPTLFETWFEPQVLDVEVIDLEAVISRSGG